MCRPEKMFYHHISRWVIASNTLNTALLTQPINFVRDFGIVVLLSHCFGSEDACGSDYV